MLRKYASLQQWWLEVRVNHHFEWIPSASHRVMEMLPRIYANTMWWELGKGWVDSTTTPLTVWSSLIHYGWETEPPITECGWEEFEEMLRPYVCFSRTGLRVLYEHLSGASFARREPFEVDVEYILDTYEEFTLRSYVERFLPHLLHEDAPPIEEDGVREKVVADRHFVATDDDEEVFIARV